MDTKKEPRYIDPTTNYGFKRIFGTETNKDLLIDFLNELFKGRKDICDLHFNKNEHVGDTRDIGTVIFDLTCTEGDGTQFIVVLQQGYHENFKRAMVYHGCKLITEQRPLGTDGQWDHGLVEVYGVALMDGFHPFGGGPSDKYLHRFYMREQDIGMKIPGHPGYTFIELINFELAGEEPQGDLEDWLYVLKNMGDMEKIPTFLRRPIFQKLFNIAEYAKMDKKEKEMYNLSLKRKWDEKAAHDHSFGEGEKKGIKEGIKEGSMLEKRKVITNLIKRDYDDATIASMTEYDMELVRAIRAELGPKE